MQGVQLNPLGLSLAAIWRPTPSTNILSAFLPTCIPWLRGIPLHPRCVQCAEGSASTLAAGSTAAAPTGCVQCAAGSAYTLTAKFLVRGFDTGATLQTCDACTVDRYQQSPAKSSCIACAAGKTNEGVATKSAACTAICAAGTYAPVRGTYGAACISCPGGTYQQGDLATDHDDASKCFACAAGQAGAEGNHRADNKCGACEAGKFSVPVPGHANAETRVNFAPYRKANSGDIISLNTAYVITVSGTTDWAAVGADSAAVGIGLGPILTLHHRSSALSQIRDQVPCLFF